MKKGNKNSFVGSQITKATIVTAIIGASLGIGWSLYETSVLRNDMFGDFFPALILGTIGGLVGLPVGILIGIILKKIDRSH